MDDEGHTPQDRYLETELAKQRETGDACHYFVELACWTRLAQRIVMSYGEGP